MPSVVQGLSKASKADCMIYELLLHTVLYIVSIVSMSG